mmetsp:Transcript_17643/g.35857  ORF Transcript_17643/g.35857 Transcript_17643/m.35857 type:complete len:413 (-) Transcript_17643:174-1412(-)
MRADAFSGGRASGAGDAPLFIELVHAAGVKSDQVASAAARRLDCVREHLGHLHIGDERHAIVDREAADGIVGEDALRVLVGEHEHHLDLAPLDEVVDARLLAALAIVEQRHLDPLLAQVLGGLLGGEEGETERRELLQGRQCALVTQLLLDGHQDVLLRHAHARAHQRLEERIMVRRPETRHLARRGHLHAERRVGARQPLEGEHRRLDTRVVRRLLGVASVDLLVANHRPGRELDEVEAEHLGGEGEGAAGAQVGLDHLDLAALGDELHVERAGHLQRLRHLARDLVDELHLGGQQRLLRQHQRRVARVHARVLDVLRHRVQQQTPLLSHRVDVDLAAVLDELRDDHGLVLGDLGRLAQVARQLLLRIRHIHRRAAQDVRRAHEARVAHTFAEGERLLGRREHLPLGLVDP